MSNLDRRLTEVVHAMLAENARCEIDDVVERAYEVHGELIDIETKELLYKQVKRIVTSILKRMSEDEDEQGDDQALPGLKMPSTIAVRREDGSYYYVRTDQAVWTEVEAGLKEREDNIVRATVKRDQYRAGMDRLRPYMANNEAVTVAEALRRERDNR